MSNSKTILFDSLQRRRRVAAAAAQIKGRACIAWMVALATILAPCLSGAQSGEIRGTITDAGEVGGAASFNDNQAISMASNSTLQPSNITFSFWFNRGSGSQPNYGRIFEKGTDQNGAPWGSYAVCFNGTDKTSIAVYPGFTDKTQDAWSTASGAIAANTWYYVTMTYDGSYVKAYENGVQQYAHANTRTVFYENLPFAVGANNNTSGGFEEYFSGAIDEVRVSKVARSADWISTEYNNQSSPSIFYSVGNDINP